MAEPPKVGSSVLVGLMVFLGVSGFVASEAISEFPSGPQRVFERRVATGSTLIPAIQPLPADEEAVAPVEANPLPVVQPAAPAAKPAPPRAAKPLKKKPRATRAVRAAPQPRTTRTRILVEERRLTQDERIEQAVIDRLASNPRLTGKIGVESKDAVVRLTGWTRTVGQARHAEHDARSVPRVKGVRNEIRPRVGGSA